MGSFSFFLRENLERSLVIPCPTFKIDFFVAFAAFYYCFTQILCVCVLSCYTCVQPCFSTVFIIPLFIFSVWRASLQLLGHNSIQLSGNHLKSLVRFNLSINYVIINSLMPFVVQLIDILFLFRLYFVFSESLQKTIRVSRFNQSWLFGWQRFPRRVSSKVAQS